MPPVTLRSTLPQRRRPLSVRTEFCATPSLRVANEWMARHEAFAVQAPVAILRTLGLARANPPFFAIRPCLPPSLPARLPLLRRRCWRRPTSESPSCGRTLMSSSETSWSVSLCRSARHPRLTRLQLSLPGVRQSLPALHVGPVAAARGARRAVWLACVRACRWGQRISARGRSWQRR